MNVSDWHQPDPARMIPRASSSPNRSWAPFIGVAGTLILHAALVQTVVFGGRLHKVRPPEIEGAGATIIKAESAATESLILLSLTVIDGRNKSLAEDLASVGSAPKNQIVTMVNSDSLPHIDIPKEEIGDDNDPVATVDSGDPVARAALFGRYTGQIDARIERVWKRPRSPVNATDDPRRGAGVASASAAGNAADSFRCQVRIIQ